MSWHKFAGGCLEAFGVAVMVMILLLVVLEKCG